MYQYLSAHPDVYMPRTKEPTFFAQDLDEGRRGDDRLFTRHLDEYLALFSGWRGERRVGEGSVWYLYSQVAASRVKAFAPDAQIIIMLRDPVEAMYSLHAHFLANGSEDLTSFEEALRVERDRACGRRIPKNAYVVKGLLYTEVAKYANQVERYLNLFGRESVLVLFFEDFVADPAMTYRQVCAFLGVDPTFVPAFERANPSRVVRSRLLRDALRFHPTPIGNRMRLGPVRKTWRRLKRKLLAMNERPQARPPLDPFLRARLAQQLAPDIAHLSHLVDRDLIVLWNMLDPSDATDQPMTVM
jgi:Sulfotransferase family